ncbi:protein S100-B-like [Anomaloglossus baeobatrachus]|uniref:protein S100-B-like n=1 Tax=Anomaloglossus baeobatrachus TaxID=238106 RepID=UPI003F509BC5
MDSDGKRCAQCKEWCARRRIYRPAPSMDSRKPQSTCSSSFPKLPDGQELTELESSMVNIIRIFHCFSNEHCKLKRKNLKELINKQMSTFVKQIQDTNTLEVIFRDLDSNHDREIDFSEFAALMAMVTSACHTSFHDAE